MSKNFRRLIVFILFTAMFAGTSIAGYAKEPATDAGKVEVEDKSDIVQVIVPTDAIEIFNFILDPQELIYKTNAAAYDGKTFEEGATLFFERRDGVAQEDYNSTSDAFTVTNRGDAPIEATVSASITASRTDGFAMTDDREFTDDTRASLYLALTDGETEVPIMIDEEASFFVTIPVASEDEEGENMRSFRLTGAANKNGDWTQIKDITFEVTVTWMITADREEISSENEEMNMQEEIPAMDSSVEMTPSDISPSNVVSTMTEKE